MEKRLKTFTKDFYVNYDLGNVVAIDVNESNVIIALLRNYSPPRSIVLRLVQVGLCF